MIDTDKTLFHLGWISELKFPPLTVLLGKTAMLGIHNTTALFFAERLVPDSRRQNPLSLNQTVSIRADTRLGRNRLLFQSPLNRTNESLAQALKPKGKCSSSPGFMSVRGFHSPPTGTCTSAHHPSLT